MAFPTVAAVNGGNNTIASTEHTVNLPSGIEEGDLLLAFFVVDKNRDISFPGGWTQLFQAARSFYVQFGAWYRIADGTEGATIIATTSVAQMTAHTTYRITGYSGVPEVGFTADGSSSSPNPPSLYPSWGAQDTLWFAAEGNDYNRTVNSYPTDYTDGRNDYADSTEGCGIGTARRELNATYQNPTDFSISLADEWVANTVAIQPIVSPPGLENKSANMAAKMMDAGVL